MQITRKSPVSQKWHQMELSITQDQVDLYMETKKCKICKEVKPLDEFRRYYQNQQQKYYFHSYCKTCLTARSYQHQHESGYRALAATLRYYNISIPTVTKEEREAFFLRVKLSRIKKQLKQQEKCVENLKTIFGLSGEWRGRSPQRFTTISHQSHGHALLSRGATRLSEQFARKLLSTSVELKLD